MAIHQRNGALLCGLLFHQFSDHNNILDSDLAFVFLASYEAVDTNDHFDNQPMKKTSC